MDDCRIYVGCGFRTSDVTKKEMESFVHKYGGMKPGVDTATYISDVINEREDLKVFRPLGGAFVLFEGIHFLGEDEKEHRLSGQEKTSPRLSESIFRCPISFPINFGHIWRTTT